jgi:nuclear GTP-binding protein
MRKQKYKFNLKAKQINNLFLFFLNQHEKVHILEVETFEDTFGPKAQRKKPKLGTCDMEDYVRSINERAELYNEEKDSNIVRDNGGVSDEAMFPLFKAGQSKRIWRELHKVLL